MRLSTIAVAPPQPLRWLEDEIAFAFLPGGSPSSGRARGEWVSELSASPPT